MNFITRLFEINSFHKSRRLNGESKNPKQLELISDFWKFSINDFKKILTNKKIANLTFFPSIYFIIKRLLLCDLERKNMFLEVYCRNRKLCFFC